MAEGSSRPQIMFKATYSNGQTVMVDDYREAWLVVVVAAAHYLSSFACRILDEVCAAHCRRHSGGDSSSLMRSSLIMSGLLPQAYWWLRDKTPEDARVMAWWDYGYQITGIANRTSVADGNTWNHEHIATLGRILTAPQEEAHSYARHLADYVLVWAGGGGDDLAKSPHLARIGNAAFHGRLESVSFAPRSSSFSRQLGLPRPPPGVSFSSRTPFSLGNSVFHGHCGNDPTCSNFGFCPKKRNAHSCPPAGTGEDTDSAAFR